MNALRFEVNAEEKLFDLSEELTGKTYCPSRAVCFILERPKMREIIAADFRDRIVHQRQTPDAHGARQAMSAGLRYPRRAVQVQERLHTRQQRIHPQANAQGR
nr:hypothetical protein [Candidatus Magnetobacterium casensis]